MNDITNITQYNWIYVLVGVILIGVGIKFVWVLFDFFVDKLGITTKKAIKEKENQELLQATASGLETATATIEELEAQRQLDYEENKNRLNYIETQLKEDVSCTKSQNEKVLEALSNLDVSFKNMDSKLTASCEGTIELLRETIDIKCDQYINVLHGVPKSEVEILIGLRDAYDNFNTVGVVANHKRQAIIDECLNLPVLPDNKGYIYERIN